MKEVTTIYKIYCLESPDVLRSVEPDGYHIKTTNRKVLVDLDDVINIYTRNEFVSQEDAMSFLEKNKGDQELMGKKFTILPIVEIDYNY